MNDGKAALGNHLDFVGRKAGFGTHEETDPFGCLFDRDTLEGGCGWCRMEAQFDGIVIRFREKLGERSRLGNIRAIGSTALFGSGEGNAFEAADFIARAFFVVELDFGFPT